MGWLGGAALAAVAAVLVANALNLNTWVLSKFKDDTPLTAQPSVIDPADKCGGGDGWVAPSQRPQPPISPQGGIGWTAPSATPATPVTINVMGQGKAEGAIVTGIDLVNVHQFAIADPAHYMWLGDCGGGPVERVDLGYQLINHDPSNGDDMAPNLSIDAGPRLVAGSPVRAFPRVVSHASPDLYVLHVYVDGSAAYSFDVELSWQNGDDSGSIVLDNSGRHYSVAGIRDASNFASDGQTWQSRTPEQAEAEVYGASAPDPSL